MFSTLALALAVAGADWHYKNKYEGRAPTRNSYTATTTEYTPCRQRSFA
jgi:hypothetical protein